MFPALLLHVRYQGAVAFTDTNRPKGSLSV
jgi:hypothetical protein